MTRYPGCSSAGGIGAPGAGHGCPGDALLRQRKAARVLLLDEVGDVLLFRGGDPARPAVGTWWFTPGGGIDDGESAEEAARRELREETGLIVGELGKVVLRRHVEHQFQGMRIAQDEEFFLVRCQSFEPDAAGWTDVERQVVEEHRWWTREKLRNTGDTLYPEDLADLLDQLERN